MTQDSKNLIKNFLIKGFAVKKIKNNFDRWNRVIHITGGYIRQQDKSYKWVSGINYGLAVDDLIKVVHSVFGCTYEEAKLVVEEYLKTCPPLNSVHKKSPRFKPKKY